MTIDPGAKQKLEPWTSFADSEDIPDWIANAYIESYRGPRGDKPGATETGETGPADPADMVTPAMLRAHYRLGECRPERGSCVCVHSADDPEGFGPALQVVTHHGSMLLDSVTVLLHRLGVAYAGIMAPVFDVHRSPTGDLLSIEPLAPGASQFDGEAWIYVPLSPSVDSKALAEVERLLAQSEIEGLGATALRDYARRLQQGLGGLHELLVATYFEMEPSVETALLST